MLFLILGSYSPAPSLQAPTCTSFSHLLKYYVLREVLSGYTSSSPSLSGPSSGLILFHSTYYCLIHTIFIHLLTNLLSVFTDKNVR